MVCIYIVTKRILLSISKSVIFAFNWFFIDHPREAGTKKNYRMHDLVTPDALRESIPEIGAHLYLYELHIEPKFHLSSAQNDHNEDDIKIFKELLQSNRSYGILSRKKLPRMGLMKFFQSFGEIDGTVNHEPVPLKLGNPELLAELKRFHCILFRNVLDVWKSFFAYDDKDSVIIVPTNNHQIDWHIVERFQNWSALKEKSVNERRNAAYRRDEWLYSVVCPWYRVDQNARYIVTEVSEHRTPLSPFPNEQFQNYEEYVINKYPDISQVVNKNQFLIGVKGMTSHLNRLHPGEGEDGRRNNRSRGPEYLIPELCHNFQYPGDLWLKAIILPSMLHRITYILHAESIRVNINQYLGIQIDDYYPNPLTDKMARNKPSSARMSTYNPIAHPRVDEIPAKELKASEIEKFDVEATRLGKEIKELKQPVDLERNFDQVYEVDIDYYYQFINGAMNSLNLNDDRNRSNLLSPHRFHPNVPALCDVVQEDKLHIKILDVKLSSKITRGIEQNDILSAITTASSADVFHMELFEVLGDAFLKFGASLYLIQRHTEWHEGFLTTIKGQIVGNRNLCYSAIQHNISGMIKVLQFNPKHDWQPPMLKVAEDIQVK